MRKLFLAFMCSLLVFIACDTATKTEIAGSGSNDTTVTNNTEESKEERNKKIVLESITAIINNNPDDALKHLDPGAVDYYDGSGPPIKGLDSIKAGMKMWMNNVQDYKGENLEAVADGNKVMVYGDWSGTFKNDFMGMKVAGKKFSIKDVDIFTFNDQGKITEHRSVQSVAGLVASTKQKNKQG